MRKKILFLSITAFCCCTLSFSQTLVSQGKEAWASSEIGGGGRASYGNDGLANTRWESIQGEGADPSWWAVDLGKEYYVSCVEIDWERACAKEYKIQISNDRNFTTFTDIAEITDAPNDNHTETVATDLNIKGRYLRVFGISRHTGYGYSFYECRVYGREQLIPCSIKLIAPYVQYMKVRLTPADLNGIGELIIQNKDEIVDLEYNTGSPLKIDLLDFRGDFFVCFWALKQGSQTDTIRGESFNAVVYDGMEINVELTPKLVFGDPLPVADAGRNITIYAPLDNVELDGSKSQDREGGGIAGYLWTQVSGPNQAVLYTPNQAKTIAGGLMPGDYKFKLTVTNEKGLTGDDHVVVSVLPPEQIDFNLTVPPDKAMITDTRKPVLTWEACTDATKYEIFVNITRDDYEWYASGNLLDRFTKVGESTTESFTLPINLVDRWTYKWYVVASTPSGAKFSNRQQFGLYIPVPETEDDGVAIIYKDGYGCRDMNKNGTIEPFEDWHLTPEERLADLMSRLTTEEKVRQLFYEGKKVPTEGFHFNSGDISDLKRTQMAAARNTRMGIPVAFLGDNVHGFKTAYPTEIGLAAMRDMDMVYQCGNMQRIEHKYGGHTGSLSPIAEVGTKVLYPRFQEGCGENADDAAAMIRALVCGMQGGPELNPQSMLVTVKHWPSQGAGGEGPTQYDEVTIKYHIKPWFAAVEANAASVMPGYGSSPFLDPSGKGACSSKKTIDYLRKEIGFEGFIVTDWLPSGTSVSVESIDAGIDVMGGSGMDHYYYDEYIEPYTVLEDLVAAVGLERINEAASRVLNAKIRLGMFENPYSDPTYVWQTKDHHEIALNAARKSITLLMNHDGILPLDLKVNDEIVVGGPDYLLTSKPADPHVIWHTSYYDNPLVKSHLKAIEDRANVAGIKVFQDNSPNPKVAIVFIGEKSYTHGTEWDDKNPDIPEEQLDVIRGFKARDIKVVTVVISPRPYVLTSVAELSDALLLIYRGGNGIFQAVAECLFGDFEPKGKLPYQLPRAQSQIGTDQINNQIEKWDLPYDLGASAFERQAIRGYIDQDLLVPPIYGDPLFQYGFGMNGFLNKPTDITLNKEEKSRISISPNPFSSRFTVNLSDKNEYNKLTVFDLTGKMIAEKPVVSTTISFDLSDYPSGIYLLKAIGNAGVETAKIIKRQ